MSLEAMVFRTDDGLLEIEVGRKADKPAYVRIAHDEMEFKSVKDFDEWIQTLQHARNEFTAVRAA